MVARLLRVRHRLPVDTAQLVREKRRLVEDALAVDRLSADATRLVEAVVRRKAVAIISLGLCASVETVLARSLSPHSVDRIRCYGRQSAVAKVSKAPLLRAAIAAEGIEAIRVCYVGDTPADRAAARSVGTAFFGFRPYA